MKLLILDKWKDLNKFFLFFQNENDKPGYNQEPPH